MAGDVGRQERLSGVWGSTASGEPTDRLFKVYQAAQFGTLPATLLPDFSLLKLSKKHSNRSDSLNGEAKEYIKTARKAGSDDLDSLYRAQFAKTESQD